MILIPTIPPRQDDSGRERCERAPPNPPCHQPSPSPATPQLQSPPPSAPAHSFAPPRSPAPHYSPELLDYFFFRNKGLCPAPETRPFHLRPSPAMMRKRLRSGRASVEDAHRGKRIREIVRSRGQMHVRCVICAPLSDGCWSGGIDANAKC
jgi:hypothetical protein